MSTSAADVNNTDSAQTSDFDSFINEPPYNFCWRTNNKGVKAPVFPYVISILGPKNLKTSEENTLRAYLEALIKDWRWKKEAPIIILADKSGRTGEIVLETIDFFKNQSANRNRQKDANQLFYARFQDQMELISRLQKETANNTSSSSQSGINAHLTIIFWQRENNEDHKKSNIDAIKDYLRSLHHGFNDHTLNSILQIQPENPDTQNNNSYLPVYFYNSRNNSKNKVKSPSRLIKTLFIKNDLDNLKIINNVNQEFKVDVEDIDELYYYMEDNSTKQLFKISCYYHQLADLCKKKMKLNTNFFCFAFLLISICNALIVYTNSACINSFGASVFQLARYCATGDNDNAFCDKILTYKYNPIKIQTTISNDVIKSKIEKLKKTYISFYFFKISKANFICTVFWILIITLLPPLALIVRCTIVHYCSFWHKKYHHCRTLSDCLKILSFLKFAGIKDHVCKDILLSKQGPGWLTAAVIGIYASIPFDYATPADNDPFEYKSRIEFLNKHWIIKIADKYRKRINKSGWSALELFSKVGVLLWSVVTVFLIMFFVLSHNCSGGFLWISFLASAATILFFFICGLFYYWSLSWGRLNSIIQKLGRWVRKFDWIKIILFGYIILSCFGWFFESHRLSKLCTQSQIGCLNKDCIFSFISQVSISEEFILVRNLIISFVLIAFAFLRMEMFDKERKIIFQLRYSFKSAHANIYNLLLLDQNNPNQLLEIAKNRDSYYSGIINRINDCMMQKSDIISILESAKLQIQSLPLSTTTTEPVKNSNDSPFKKTWNFIWSHIPFFGEAKEQNLEIQQNPEVQQMAAIPDEYIKIFEDKLNLLRKYKLNKLQELKNNELINPNVPVDIVLKECQNILLRLGDEYLTKRIDWLLDVKDRDLKPPK